MKDDVQAVFEPNGPLARDIADYRARPQQQRMAHSVADALECKHTLIVEAGTGTGKTYAYLVPALLSGLKIIISTGTKHLQDQLFHRDLPLVRNSLQVMSRVALLKGRANYLCLHRLELLEGEGRTGKSRTGTQLHRIRDWIGHTVSGDVMELTSIPEDSPIWPQVTSTTENCLGAECGCYDKCFVVKARRKAQEADLLVVNHHLLFADMALKEEGFGELLPGADAIVLDEAHQLPEIASQFFGISISSRQLMELLRDAEMEHIKEAGELKDLPDACRDMEKAVRDTRLALGNELGRGSWPEAWKRSKLQEAMGRVKGSLAELCAWLENEASRSKGMDACWRRGILLVQRLDLMTNDASEEYVHWFETRTRSFSLHLTPLNIAETFQEHTRVHQAAWIFTSATLTVCKKFDHFAQRMGLSDPETLFLDSPFDYQKNALLYLPEGLPEPNSPEYTGAIAELAYQVIAASGGRTFLLFTSYRALNAAAEYLQNKSEFPLLVQGSAPRSELLERFRELGNAVLLGTNSFWEGVDVRGQALSCVMIDRLPFASPGDPVLQGRIEALKARGGNPFMEYQLPNAVIALKQGIGRLIRDHQDRGVLVLCDPRIQSKSYGRIFLKSLPDMPVTRKISDIDEFFMSDGSVPLTVSDRQEYSEAT